MMVLLLWSLKGVGKPFRLGGCWEPCSLPVGVWRLLLIKLPWSRGEVNFLNRLYVSLIGLKM